MPTGTPASSSAPAGLAAAREVLQQVFGFDGFRPGQEAVIEAVLSGRDTLAVMPTGGGKSLCYQAPAILDENGTTVVISPLLALMKDQVDALQNAGVAAAAVNSTMTRDEQMRTIRAAARGELRLLYVAPERFADMTFMAALRSTRVGLLAIDEAHCISQWGHDFRPSYRDLGNVRPQLGSPPIVALTATADPRVRDDIVARLGLQDPAVLVAGFDRPNLRFDVVRVKSRAEKAERIAEKLRELRDESAIVYCGTRKHVDELSETLRAEGIACSGYHAGMDAASRKRIQEAFAADRLQVIVATNAFGMGIDKPDVRMVLHHDMPDSIESYYQEAGRAGRDGEPAECILYYARRDRGLREYFIELSHPEPAMVIDVYRRLEVARGNFLHARELMAQKDEPGINAAIQALVDSGLAERRGYEARALRPNGEDAIDLAGLEAHRAHAVEKLDAMQAYAESRNCLRARFLRYFGEGASADSCSNCGPCMAPVQHGPAALDGPAEAVFQRLRDLRRRLADEAGVPPYVIFHDTTLRDMAKKLPRNRSEMLAVSGVGAAKFERYGEAFLDITAETAGGRTPEPHAVVSARRARRERQAASDRQQRPTVYETLDLVREGLDLGEMAERRGYTRSTIANHIATLIREGLVDDIDPWLDGETLWRIQSAAGFRPIEKIGPLKEQLGDGVSYEQLHIARAWLNRSRS